jgi:kynurenine formamidase
LLTPAATIEHDGYNELHVRMGSHTGTHVDAPYHFNGEGLRVDELDLHLFAGPGVVVDATQLAPRTRIDWPILSPYVGQLGPNVIVLLHTRSSAHAGPFLDHPFLDADALPLPARPRGSYDMHRRPQHR